MHKVNLIVAGLVAPLVGLEFVNGETPNAFLGLFLLIANIVAGCVGTKYRGIQ